jgi:hypothetical protein
VELNYRRRVPVLMNLSPAVVVCPGASGICEIVGL